MILNMLGGAGLNFGVTAFKDETSLLEATPAANEIGVITDIPFANWYFDENEPGTPANGDLWFKTGSPVYSDAGFSAVPGNTIMVYPLSAFQRIDGEWREISAKTYQEKDGTLQWVEWIRQTVHLVRDGVLCVNFKTDDPGHMTVSQGEGAVTFNAKGGVGYAVVPLDLTHYRSFIIEGTKFIENNISKIGVWKQDVTPAGGNADTSVPFTRASGRFTLDVSALSGIYNIGINLLNSGEIIVTNFYLKRSE